MASTSSSGSSSPELLKHGVCEVEESNVTLLDLFREGAREVGFRIITYDGGSNLRISFTVKVGTTCRNNQLHSKVLQEQNKH